MRHYLESSRSERLFSGLIALLVVTLALGAFVVRADDSDGSASAAATNNATELPQFYQQGTPPGAPDCPVGQTPVMWFQPDTGYFFSGSCQFTGCPAGYQDVGGHCEIIHETPQQCSGSNACGTLYGTIQPDGRCSVGGPTLHPNYEAPCSSTPNLCNMRNGGRIGCDGFTCEASPPPDNMCRVTDTPLPSGCGAGTRNDTCPPPTNCTPTTATSCGETSTYYPCNPIGSQFVTVPNPASPACTASVPSTAGGQCWSAPNDCGQRTEGVIQWSGLCNASPPPSCMLSSGGGGWSGATSGGGSPIPTYDPIPEPPPPPPPPSFVRFTTTEPGQIFNASGHLQARPTLIRTTTVSRLYWNVTNVSSCSVTGTNGDTWSGSASGTAGATTSPLETRTIYKLQCTSLPGSGAANVNESVTINIAPQFNEQ